MRRVFFPILVLPVFFLQAENWMESTLGGAFSAPKNGSGRSVYYVQQLARFNAGEARILAETSGQEKKPGESDLRPESNRVSQALVSAQWSSPFLYFSAGSRFLPGPATGYLLDADRYSGFSDTSSGRNQSSAFLQPFPRYFLPGIFYLEQTGTAGIFLADSQHRFFFAAHPGTKTGALSFNYGGTNDGLRVYGDFFKNSLTPEGFFQLNHGKRFQDIYLHIEAERRESWDKNAAGEWIDERKGRSGLGAANLIFYCAELETAGQDIGLYGLRMGGLTLKYRLGFFPGAAAARGRYYRQAVYASSLDYAVNAGGALGWMLDENRWGASLFYEERSTGRPTAELKFHWKSRYAEFSFGAAARTKEREGEDRSFLFVQTEKDRGSSANFFPDARAALLLQIKSGYVYLYLSSIQTGQKSAGFVNLQVRAVF